MESVKNKSGIELIIFERIRLIVGEGREAGIYQSRIEDLINGGVIVSTPEFISGHTLIRNGVDVQVQIVRQDAAYQFYSRIHARTSGALKQVILTPPRRLERVQRRMFARVDMATRVTYGELTDDLGWSSWEQEVTWHKTRSSNISGGGVLMTLPETIKPDRLVVMQVEVFGEVDLPKYVLAVCRRTFKSEDLSYGGFEFIVSEYLNLHFKRAVLTQMPDVLTSFSTQAQDKLVTLLFNKQIEQRQRGVL